jgi:predicted flap endonuclease-1-like 5' DNA nuclease
LIDGRSHGTIDLSRQSFAMSTMPPPPDLQSLAALPPALWIGAAAIAVTGWLAGYLGRGGSLTWKRRYDQERARFETFRHSAQRMHRDYQARIAELKQSLEAAKRSAEFPAAPAPAPAPAAGPASSPPASGEDLTRLGGVDDLLHARLNALGITRFEDIMALSVEDEIVLEERLPVPAGYIAREQWRAHAALLHDHTSAVAPQG